MNIFSLEFLQNFNEHKIDKNMKAIRKIDTQY